MRYVTASSRAFKNRRQTAPGNLKLFPGRSPRPEKSIPEPPREPGCTQEAPKTSKKLPKSGQEVTKKYPLLQVARKSGG